MAMVRAGLSPPKPVGNAVPRCVSQIQWHKVGRRAGLPERKCHTDIHTYREVACLQVISQLTPGNRFRYCQLIPANDQLVSPTYLPSCLEKISSVSEVFAAVPAKERKTTPFSLKDK